MVSQTFHGRGVTGREPSGMVAHLQMFRAVVGAGCRMQRDAHTACYVRV